MISYLKHIILFVFLLLLQFIFLNNFILYDVAFCFIYITFILFLPIETPAMLLIFLAFLMGISVDIYSDTLGMNTSASVLTAFLRPFLLKMITPKSGYDSNFHFSIYETGIRWFFIYSFALIFIHLFFLFTLDASDLSMTLEVLLKTISSTILTVVVIIVGAYLFQSSKSK